MSARVYIFGFSPEEEERIQERFAEIGIPAAVRIGKNQGSVVLRDIIEGGLEGSAEMRIDERIVLMHEVSEKGIHSLMQLIKELPVPPPIFAVVTEHSINWTFEELARHLLEEKRSMEARRETEEK